MSRYPGFQSSNKDVHVCEQLVADWTPKQQQHKHCRSPNLLHSSIPGAASPPLGCLICSIGVRLHSAKGVQVNLSFLASEDVLNGCSSGIWLYHPPLNDLIATRLAELHPYFCIIVMLPLNKPHTLSWLRVHCGHHSTEQAGTPNSMQDSQPPIYTLKLLLKLDTSQVPYHKPKSQSLANV